jgi:prepilin-type N-terminal cleavage/methylation domain-containing protein
MKKQSGFTLIELLLVLAIIGIISAIAIPALLGQRARARDKSCISNMEGRVGDLISQYDKFKEAGYTNTSIATSLTAYLTHTGGADKNPWNLAASAFVYTVDNVGSGVWTTQSNAVTALRVIAAGATKGQANFGISFPGTNIPGFLGGCVLIDGKVEGSNTVVKVSAIE